MTTRHDVEHRRAFARREPVVDAAVIARASPRK
jgi:hypothetical protein